MVVAQKPHYLANKLELKKPGGDQMFPHRQAYTFTLSGKYTTTRSGFIYRAARVYNNMPIAIRSCMSTPKFKKLTKKWVSENIKIKP